MEYKYRACQIWAVLVIAAMMRYPITDKDLSAATGLDLNSKEMEHALSDINSFCQTRQWPPLADIVRDKAGIAGDRSEEVYDHDWTRQGANAFAANLEKRIKIVRAAPNRQSV